MDNKGAAEVLARERGTDAVASCRSTHQRTYSEAPVSLELVGTIDHRVVPVIACTTQQPNDMIKVGGFSHLFWSSNDSIGK